VKAAPRARFLSPLAPKRRTLQVRPGKPLNKYFSARKGGTNTQAFRGRGRPRHTSSEALADAYEKICEADRDQIFGYGDEDIFHIKSPDQARAGLIAAEGTEHGADPAQERSD
jgi:hypothetical protein